MEWLPLIEHRKKSGAFSKHTTRRNKNGQLKTGKWYRLTDWYAGPIIIDTDISIIDGDFVLAVEETRLLDVHIDGENPQGATFESSDPLIATVDEDGLVTGVSEGQATITATTVEEPTASDSVLVNVGTYEYGTSSDTWTFET